MKRKNLAIALLFNVLIIIFEIVGFILSTERHGFNAIKYYTQLSNFLTLIVNVIFCVCAIISFVKKNNIKKWVVILRYISTLNLTITLIIVLTILIPAIPNSFSQMMLKNSNLYYHFICPILSIVSFMFFERGVEFDKSKIYLSLVPTVVYGVVCLILNALKVITGPYPFFYVYEFKWYILTFYLLSIITGIYIIAVIIFYLFNKKWEKSSKNNKKVV